ncbi:MAG: hypothetical protein IT574_09735 [Candidatus Aureabacteria bacterium]|nr:hypothetical protein [Candidatus Auribacterota bacterium]HOE27183.1 hypothetical protein [bacterium]HQM52070.1 hypothetical protein [bacterium]
MAQLQPKDKVQWRAGDTPSSSHLRTGVIKEVLPGGLCLVRTKVDGEMVVEEIRMARLKPVEPPPEAPKKKGGARRAGKAGKAAPAAEKAAPKAKKAAPKAKKARRRKKSKKKAA